MPEIFGYLPVLESKANSLKTEFFSFGAERERKCEWLSRERRKMDAWKDASQGVSKGEENHILRERRGERRNRVAAKKIF